MVYVIIISIFVVLILVSDFFYVSAFARRNRNILDDGIIKVLSNVKVDLPQPMKKVISTFDKVKLMGFFYINSNVNTVAIVVHGYGLSHNEMLAIADMYYNKFGYTVLTPDLRGHGESEGKYIGFGWHDRLDILEWIRYTKQMLGVNVNIILHGISMGASTVLMVGEEKPDNVRCVISDCAYTSISDIVKYRLKKEYKLPCFPFVNLVNVALKIRSKYSIYDGNIISKIGNIKVPVLYIHGGKDEYIPTNWVYKLYDRTGSKKDLYICDGADHAQSIIKDPENYFLKVKSFLQSINL